MSERTVQIEYAKDPVNFRKMYDLLGLEEMSTRMGYAPNSVRQMYDGRRAVRQFIEFACELYLSQKEKQETAEKIFFFTASKDSKEFTTIEAVAKAMGVTIQML